MLFSYMLFILRSVFILVLLWTRPYGTPLRPEQTILFLDFTCNWPQVLVLCFLLIDETWTRPLTISGTAGKITLSLFTLWCHAFSPNNWNKSLIGMEGLHICTSIGRFYSEKAGVVYANTYSKRCACKCLFRILFLVRGNILTVHICAPETRRISEGSKFNTLCAW